SMALPVTLDRVSGLDAGGRGSALVTTCDAGNPVLSATRVACDPALPDPPASRAWRYPEHGACPPAAHPARARTPWGARPRQTLCPGPAHPAPAAGDPPPPGLRPSVSPAPRTARAARPPSPGTVCRRSLFAPGPHELVP